MINKADIFFLFLANIFISMILPTNIGQYCTSLLFLSGNYNSVLESILIFNKEVWLAVLQIYNLRCLLSFNEQLRPSGWFKCVPYFYIKKKSMKMTFYWKSEILLVLTVSWNSFHLPDIQVTVSPIEITSSLSVSIICVITYCCIKIQTAGKSLKFDFRVGQIDFQEENP